MKLEPPLLHAAPPDPGRWDALVRDAREASVFHTAAWAELWTAEWRNARWEAVVLEEGGAYAGAIGAIVRRRGFLESIDAMPFATYGGPIVRDGHPDPGAVRARLLDAYARWTGRARVLRSQLTWYRGDPAAFPQALPPSASFTHVLPLGPDFDQVAARFAPSTRRLVRQSEESGLTIGAIGSAEELDAFQDLADETVRRRGGSPKARSLYERIFERLVPRGLARFHLVRKAETVVAGSLHFFHEGIAVNWLPVSREDAWPLRPNNFLIARILESLCAAGYLEYNFGASPASATGLIRFKEGWGAVRQPVLVAGRRSALHRRLRAEAAPCESSS